MLRDAGAHRSRDEKDLVELLLVQLNTDEFKGPRERLDTMFETLWNAPVNKPKAAYNILLAACAKEAVRVSDNSSVKKDVILRTAEKVWAELSAVSQIVDTRAVSLMYRICGDCKDLDLAREIRDHVDDPVIVHEKESVGPGSQPKSSEDTTAAYILCLGKCGRPSEAEQMYFSHENREHRSSDKVLSALFRAYVVSNKISKAESLIAMFGSGFLNVQSCNVFVKQCAQLRMHDTAFDFVQRMSRKATGFPSPTATTYNLLLRGLSAGTGAEDREVAADRALVIVDQMKAQGIQPTTVTYNTLIRSFVFRNQVGEALDLLETMKNPNRITFSHLMLGAANVSDLELAQRLLRMLVRAGERPNYGFCKSYLEVVARTEGVTSAFEEAERITEQFGDVLVFGDVGSREVVRMALINACGTVGDLRAAFRTLDVKLGSGDEERGHLAPLYVGTVLMQVCLQCKAHGRALEVFNSLKDAGLQPNFEVYESLIYGLSSYVREEGQRRSRATDYTLDVLDVYAESSEDTHNFDKRNPAMDSATINTSGLVEGRVSHMSPEDIVDDEHSTGPPPEKAISVAVDLLREMHEAGVARAYRQAAYVYNTLIAAAAAVGDFELATQVFNKMSRRNNAGVVYLSDTTDCVDQATDYVDHATDSRNRDILASLVSTGMFESDFEFPAATVGTYNSMIYAAWKCGQPWFSFEVFDMMQTDRTTEPNAATLSLLADIALGETEVPEECQTRLLRALDKVPILSEEVCRKRVRLRQKLLSLRWT